MIWNDRMIREACERQNLVTPYDPSLINPASIDLRLGNLIRRTHRRWDYGFREGDQYLYEDHPLWRQEAEEFTEFFLMPGQFVLCCSLEFVRIPANATAMLYLKSSIGRSGLEHSHSALGDPGFGLGTPNGAQWTFEFANVSPKPFKLVAGARLMQMQLISMAEVPERLYGEVGRYNDQAGPTPAIQK